MGEDTPATVVLNEIIDGDFYYSLPVELNSRFLSKEI